MFFSFIDLELAAEIGKVLLEKNRELELLLRSSQEYTEEQILRAQVKVYAFRLNFLVSVTTAPEEINTIRTYACIWS